MPQLLTLEKYDPFGRLTEIDQPDSVTPGMSDKAVTISYQDPNFASQPVTQIHTRTADGPPSQPRLVDHYRFVDGFGDTVASLDPSGIPGMVWTVSGLHQRYQNGLRAVEYKPFDTTTIGAATFYPSPPKSFVAWPTPTRTFTYDGAGRVVSQTDFQNALSLYVYHFGVGLPKAVMIEPNGLTGTTAAASVQVFDPQQSTAQLSSTTIYSDFLGRTIETDVHLNNGPSDVTADNVTGVTYNSVGQPTLIVQPNPGGQQSYTRWMQYDSLGRLVFNAEPNTSSAGSQPLQSTSFPAWTYAYNDAGQLVGTSDARGCGENIFYDGLGRLQAEDYSPCQASQPAYTRADPVAGQNTEAFYVYDNYGRLSKTYDRAAFSTYLYDARGRVQTIERQVAFPTTLFGASSSSSSSSGSGFSISGVVSDALGNPLQGATIQLTGGCSGMKTSDMNGQYAFQGLSGTCDMTATAPNTKQPCSFYLSPANAIKATTIQDFQGHGSGCGGTPSTTPYRVTGAGSISGVITGSDGLTGVGGVAVNLTGSTPDGSPLTTHTDASGFYFFNGLTAPGGFTITPVASQNCNVAPNPTSPPPVNLSLSGTPPTFTQNFTASGSGCSQGGVASTGSALEENYSPHVFVKTFVYSEANRVTTATTGADVAPLAPSGPASSAVNISYLDQGSVSSVGSSYGLLLRNQEVDVAGRVVLQTFGDKANTTATFGYDNNETLTSYVLQRAAGPFNGAWTTYVGNSAPSANPAQNTLQTVLTSLTIGPDLVGNPVTVTDTAPPGPWPAGAEPAATRNLTYSDDYRLRTATTRYAGPASPVDSFTPPYQAEELSGSNLYVQPTSTPQSRVKFQSYLYDVRGNMTNSNDDIPVGFDRSLGPLTGTSTGPDQFAGTSPAQGAYDLAGNMSEISVQTGTQQSTYAYNWDEVGRLASAVRADKGQTAVTEEFAYDCNGARVIASRQLSGGTSLPEYTATVFDSLVLQHAAFPGAPGDYERDAKTEHVYLSAAGMMLGHAFDDEGGTLPQSSATGSNRTVHVLMPLADRLGSTSFVIDHDTSELVERPAYLAYGAVDSDYRPSRWASLREDVRYTGHWDNAEVGLIYFGARYYSPRLARFISPDPLTIHALGGDTNPYALVRGSPLRYVDSFGLGDTAAEPLDSGLQPGGLPPPPPQPVEEPTAPPATPLDTPPDTPPDLETVYVRGAPRPPPLDPMASAVYSDWLSDAATSVAGHLGDFATGPFRPGGGLQLLSAQVEHGVESAWHDPAWFVQGYEDKGEQLGRFLAAVQLIIWTGLPPGPGLVPVGVEAASAPLVASPLVAPALLATARGGGDERTPERMTNREAREAASDLGFKEVKGSPVKSHGQLVFQRGNSYISPDVDAHSGGTWKMFDRLGNRVGTFNEDLSLRIGD